MRSGYLLLALCCLRAGWLYAEPVYTYTATSVYMQHTVGVTDTSITASGPGFSLQGGIGGAGSPPLFQVGQEIPLTISFQTGGGADTGTTVDYGGITQTTYNSSGSTQAFSSSSFVIPPNPNAMYTFPAQVTGQFTARPMVCGPGEPSPTPPCDASAVLLIRAC